MSTRILISRGAAALLMAVLPVLPVLQPVAASAQGPGPIDLARLDAFLVAGLHRNGIPGLAVGIVDAGRVVHVAGFGRARDGGDPVTATTPFVLASASKPITATAVMQLVDAGRIDLDAPVQRYLPEFRTRDAGRSAGVTLRELLTHTAGLPVTACERDGGSLAEFVRGLREVSLERPGRHVYCSGNYNVLGRIIERVTGQSFAAYVRDHVFRRLGMAHSYAELVPAQRDGLAQGHRWLFGLRRPMQHFNPAGVPSGYLMSSAQDLSYFVAAQLAGGTYEGRRLLSTTGTAAMQRPAVSAGDGTTYGLGWQQGTLGGVPAIYHYGANYDSETLIVLEPGSARGAALLINAQGLVATGAFRSLEVGLVRILDGRDPGSPGLSVPRLYGLVDAALVVASVLILLPLLRVLRWSRTPRSRRRQLLRVSCELAVPVLVLSALCLLATSLGATLGQMVMLIPDLVGWVLAACGTVLATGLAHAVAARGHASRRDIAADSTTSRLGLDAAR